MPRPKCKRRIGYDPAITYFKPAGVPTKELEHVELASDEFEAIRLKDALELDQNEAAKKMNISQPTFHRVLLTARKKIGKAITQGKAIRIISDK